MNNIGSSHTQDRDVVHYDGHSDAQSDDSSSKEELKKQDDVSQSEAEGHTPLVNKLQNMSV